MSVCTGNKTNADCIRAMTDEKLAEHLFRHICNWSCPPQKEYIKASCGGGNPDCVKCWLDWLKKEVSDAELD